MMKQQPRSAVRAIIIQDHRLLLCRYKGVTGDYFVCPGGGQRFGEDMPAALARECKEEIGCGVRVGDMALVTDAIFHTANDTSAAKRHQVEHHFVCEILSGQTAQAGPKPDTDFLGLEWVPIDRLGELLLYPPQLLGYIASGTHGFPVYQGRSG